MMIDLKMEVYTPALDLIGFLEIQRSVIWEDKAFSAGSFSIESLITDESKSMLKPDNIIWIEGETAGIIEYAQENADAGGPYITVKGRTLTGILDRRILWGLYNLKGTAPEIMHTLVNDCCINPTRGDAESRKIPGLVLLDAPSGGDAIQIQKTGGTLLEALEQLGETYGVAFGVRFNAAVPQMEFWTRWGQDRSIHQSENNPVLYSTELDDVLSSEYTYNSQDYRNVCLVAGEGEGADRVYVTVENEVEDTPDIPTPPEPPVTQQYTVTLLVDPEGGGTVSGGKTVAAGVSITVTAAPSEDYTFVEWRENGVRVSGDKAYTFTVTADRTLTAVFASQAKIEWILSSSLPYSANWRSVSYGNGRFVAVAYGGYCAYSKDGISWAAGTSLPSNYWRSVAYGGGRFVAVGSAAAYSLNGESWTPVSMPYGNWRSVTFGDGKFVAVSEASATAAYSTNGEMWITVSLPISANWYSVTYGNGRFVAVAYGGTTAAYSEDGINWEASELPSSENWYSVSCGGNRFEAISDGGTTAAYSEDGKKWALDALPVSANWFNVTFGGGRFVAVAYNGTVAAYRGDFSVPTYNIAAMVDPSGSGSVTGAGQYQEGAAVNLAATANDGYVFADWKEGGTTVHNEPDYTFTAEKDRDLVAAFAEKNPSRLPAGYTEVEYIQSSGTQYIDTKKTPGSSLLLMIDVESIGDVSGTEYFFDSYYHPSSSVNYYRLRCVRSANGIRVTMGVSSSSSSFQTLSSDNSARRMVIKMDQHNALATLDGAESVSTSASNALGTNMTTIRLLSSYNATSGFTSAKLYSCTIDNTSGSMELVPCINPSGAAGLYDLVGGTFYGNAGTGTFTAGPAV